MLNRIKAAGVDFDIFSISQSSITKTGYAVIGSIQMYKNAQANVLRIESMTKTGNAVIT